MLYTTYGNFSCMPEPYYLCWFKIVQIAWHSWKQLSIYISGPGGDLRVYLENLADAEHVQKYVEEHPFGQQAISEKSTNWGFYSKVIKSIRPSG